MINKLESWICLCLVVILAENILAEGESKSMIDSHSLKEFLAPAQGRGLSMLLLGKRSAGLQPMKFQRQIRSVENIRWSNRVVQDLLDDLFSGTSEEISLVLENEDSNSGPSTYSRPAPRGGRYRRSYPVRRFPYQNYLSEDDIKLVRAMGSPKLEEIMDRAIHEQSGAIRVPRFGRSQTDDLDNSNKLQVA